MIWLWRNVYLWMTRRLTEWFVAKQLTSQEDPVGKTRFDFTHENGMKINNRTAAFGTVLIIYESRRYSWGRWNLLLNQETKILLKGGKESLLSNLKIVGFCIKRSDNDVATSWVNIWIMINRNTSFLENPTQR
jgi:glutamate-5-semialdehyde dehydrogenase